MRDGDRETLWHHGARTSTASPRSWARASPWNASRAATACISSRTTSSRRSINPETGEVLPAGRRGGAGLHDDHEGGLPADPLPDAGHLPPRCTEPCRCGRTLVRMDRVTGRSDDMLIIRGVNVFPSQIEAVLAGDRGDRAPLPDHRGPRRQPRHPGGPGGGERTALRRDGDEVKVLQNMERRIVKDIKDYLGISAKVKLVEPKSLQRFEGKAKPGAWTGARSELFGNIPAA